MGQKNGKFSHSESGVGSENGFSSDDDMVETVKSKKALFNPFFRVLINECYSQTHNDLPTRILHRCSQQRHDVKEFLDVLGPDGKAALREGIQSFLDDVIAHLDDEEAVNRISRAYGRSQVPLRQLGHKPDFFAAMADAIATECVFVGGQVTAASPTNTFKAWTVLVGVMFTAVRDGYYDELRKSRKQSPGLDIERATLASSKGSSLDSNSSTGDRISPSASSRGSPHINRSCSTGIEPSVSQSTTKITVTEPTYSSGTAAARRAYRGSRSAAIVGAGDITNSSRSCEAICSDSSSNHRRDYRLPPQHHSHDLLRADSPRSHDGSLSGRLFKKNVSLDYDNKRRKQLEDIGRKHSSSHLSRNQSSSSSGSVFDPNRIIDAFMNDQPF